MSKIGLVIAQEYKNRVAKKSFIVMTILVPILFVGMIAGVLWLSTIEDGKEKKVAVIDRSEKYASVFTDTPAFNFDIVGTPLDSLKATQEQSELEAIIVITDDLATSPDAITIYSRKQINNALKSLVSERLNSFISKEKLLSHDIPNIEEIIEDSKSNIDIATIKWSEDGREEASSTEVAMIIGMIFTMLIYIFIFSYGGQVMNSVVQEKTNRIVEVLICSVKPFEMMMGKIISVALVGLTQFAIWIVFIGALSGVASYFFGGAVDASSLEQMQQIQAAGGTDALDAMNVQGIMNTISSLNPWTLVLFFVLYFIGGYLLYASLFAAIGSSVDNETDTSQFMMPITVIILFALYAGIYSAQNPDGPLAFWCSIVPFTSPIVMMVRLPFGVPGWELALSLVLLAATFVATTWMSAKIYRTGILMYGKKNSWRELWRWLRY